MSNKLGALIKTAIDSYVSGLSESDKREWSDSARLGLQNSINNEVEKWNSELVEIDGNHTVSENAGNQIIILKSSGVSANAVVTLPAVSTNAGRRLAFKNLNSTYKLTIQRAGSDTIESVTQFEIWAGYDYTLEFFCCSDEWKRTNRQWISLKEEDRPTTYPISAVTDTGGSFIGTSAFTNYRALGSMELQLFNIIRFTGNGILDGAYFRTRNYGSSETSGVRLPPFVVYHYNAPTGSYYGNSGLINIECDDQGRFEYLVADGILFLSPYGFKI